MQTISEAGVAQLSTPSGWSSPIVRSCWFACKQSITNNLYLPVIYFKIRRKVGTNKFNLVIVDGCQVFPWFRSRNVQEVCLSLRPSHSFMTNNHIMSHVHSALDARWLVTFPVFCAVSFALCILPMRFSFATFLPMQFSFATWYQHIHGATRPAVFIWVTGTSKLASNILVIWFLWHHNVSRNDSQTKVFDLLLTCS
jgi:hypothetical protein